MSHCRGQVLSFTSRALRYEAQLTSNKDWKTLCKAQKMDIMTVFNTKLYGVNSVDKYLSCAANCSEDRGWKVQALLIQHSDRSCPVLEFAHTNLRKPTKATVEPQILDPNPNMWRAEHTATPGYVGEKQKVRALNTTQVSGRVGSEAASFCVWLQQTSKTANLIPFSWTRRKVLNHIFHNGSIATVAAARVYSPGQFSNNHSSKPTISF